MSHPLFRLLPPDAREQELEGAVTFDGKEMQWYSVWDQQEMELEELPIRFDVEPPPPTALLLCVSEAAAAVVEQELLKLCAEHRHIVETGENPLKSTRILIFPGAISISRRYFSI